MMDFEAYRQLLSDSWGVLALFVIPIGGGIPAGVVLAQARQIPWPFMMVLYFISDIILACVFEPLMLLVIHLGRKSEFLRRVREAFRISLQKKMSPFGSHLGPFSLVMIAFGVDPMTGRAVAKASGHGFVTGWMIAIAGDMMFFTVLMISTLWLNNILGNGSVTTLVIMVLMLVVPKIIEKLSLKFKRNRKI